MPKETEPASPVESAVLSMSKQSVVFSPLVFWSCSQLVSNL